MPEYSFTIPGPLMGAVRTTQRQKFVDPRYEKYRQFKELIRCLGVGAGVPEKLQKEDEVTVTINIYWEKRQRCDIDNITKSVMDALWKNDRRVLHGKQDAYEHTGKEWMNVQIQINDAKPPKNRNLRHRGNKSKS